jgi:membrane protein implicated in regulation of membrane protease activity
MRHRLRHRFWARDGDPGPTAWVIASVSLVLPVAGVGLALIGAADGIRNGDWTWLGIGLALIGLDLVIDLVWAHPGVSVTDQPGLNRRGHQLIGRIATVSEAIDGGRGRVRIGDTVWTAEGPDLPAGAAARIVAADGAVLGVEPVVPESRP